MHKRIASANYWCCGHLWEGGISRFSCHIVIVLTRAHINDYGETFWFY